MTDATPIFATDRTAARLLDMTPAEFRGLVEGGHLPGPRMIGGLARWDMAELRRIITGEAAEGLGDVRW